MKGRTRPALWAFLILTLFFAIRSAASTATPPDPDYLNALWVAESDGVLKVATAEGGVLFKVEGAGDVRAVATDARRGVLWTFGGGVLRAYGFNGQLRAETAVPLTKEDDTHLNLAVADNDGRLWLGHHETLYRFSAAAVLEGRIELGAPLRGLTYDGQRVWAATRDRLRAYGPAGESAGRVAVDRGETVQAMAYASALGELWVATQKTLLRYATDGRRTFQANAEKITHLAADGRGGLWAATSKRVRRMDASGALLFEIAPFDGAGTVIDLVADPADRSAWVAGAKALSHIDTEGVVRHRLEFHGVVGFGRVRHTALYADILVPELTITAPKEGAFVSAPQPALSVRYSDAGIGVAGDTLRFEANRIPLDAVCEPAAETAICHPAVPLPDGDYTVTATVEDHADNRSAPAAVRFTVDTAAPTITLAAGTDGRYTNQTPITLTGSVDEPAAVTVNGAAVELDLNHAFVHSVALREGSNPVVVRALDRAGNAGTVTATVFLDTVPPAAPVITDITTELRDGQVTVTGAPGSVEAGTRITLTNTRTGESVTAVAGADGRFTAVLAAQPGDSLTLVVHDPVGNASAPASLDLTPAGAPPKEGYVPPDPATIAPPINPTVPTSVYAASAFLFSGPQAIQHGVESEIIEERRIAVLRGRVNTFDGTPLEGVTIEVLGHPEFGWTGTRPDGQFDLAVNGGGILTVRYEKAGYLPVRRPIDAPWQDWAWLPDVVMIPVDAKVTAIDLTAAEIQTARGSAVTDEDGARQATLLFPQGTQAEMVLADGATQPLTTLNVRATEYTVGPRGPAAMPGVLPPTSGYTYAVELSVDEAMAAGAKRVQFSQPVPFYLENFLDFPVGGIVPAGWYDRDKAAWIPSENGRVISVLSVTNGRADLDVEGGGQPADAAALGELGITDEERRELAALYAPGKSLWRVPVAHFTPWDCNWPYGPPNDAEPPPPEGPELEDKPDDPNECDGCIIEAENQVLGETIPIVGTPYTLNYRSDRSLGYMPSRTADIPLSGPSVPDSLKRIDLEIQVAGQVHRRSFAAAPNLRTKFVWDGRDSLGRAVRGATRLTYRLRFIYQAVYYEPALFAAAFGQAGAGMAIGRDRAAGEVDYFREHSVTVVAHLGGDGIGRWSLEPHHFYSVKDTTLYLGDGGRGRSEVEVPIIGTVAGSGGTEYFGGGFGGDGGPATEAQFYFASGIALGPDGSLYIADRFNHRIRRVGPDGTIGTVAGSGSGGIYSSGGFSGDGGPATEARLNRPWGVAFGPDGSLYIADSDNHRIRRVESDGIITTIAGVGYGGYSGDGGPATDARLNSPTDVAVSPDGGVYIADRFNHRIRRVGTDGIITTVAGAGGTGHNSGGFGGDDGLAIDAQLYYPHGIDLAPDGSLYIGDGFNHRIRRVGPNGIISTVAGSGYSGYSGDGGPATDARLNSPTDVTVHPDGSLYIADSDNHRIRRVGPEGIITLVAGSGGTGYYGGGFSGDGGSATEARLRYPRSVAFAADGVLYVADTNNHRIRRVNSSTRSALGELMVAAADGEEYYLFDIAGRHLRTRDSTTGALRHTFSYDQQGYLIGLEDGDGNVTLIERDSTGNPIAITAPGGQRTELTVDSNGCLTAVTNPAGEGYTMTYTPEGLLTGMIMPSGAQYIYDYDSVGRLTQDRDPAGGGWALARTETENGFEGRMTSAEGRTSRFGVERLSATEVVRTTTGPDGTVSTRRVTTTGTEITEVATDADGTERVLHKTPDPRAGMDAPFVDAAAVTTPGGLTQIISAARDVTLANDEDPLSLTALSESTTINGRTVTRSYNAYTRTWTETSALGRRQTMALNQQGRPIREQLASLAPATYNYDLRGRLKAITYGSNGERPYALAYDADGNLAAITDPLTRRVSFVYDPAGRVTEQTLPDGRVIRYAYDPNGNLVSLIPPGREAHLFAHTPVDLEEQYTSPALTGVRTITHYTYNKDKDLTRIERPDGGAIDYAYDTRGRLSALIYPEGRLDYGYQPATGRLATVVRADGQRLAYTYDGFLLLTETSTGAVMGMVSRTYDNNFWVKSLAVDGVPVTFGYDDDGLLTSTGALDLNRNAQNGLLEGTSLGVVRTARSHNPFGELQSESVTVDGEAVIGVVYARDALGRIVEKAETVDGATTTHAYGYDLAGRLETVRSDGVLTATYTYDANGNRTGKTTPGGKEGGTYDAQDRMTAYAGASYEYTENGDLKSKTEQGAVSRYTYDALGNLLKVELPGDVIIDYLIDGRNRRIGKKVNGRLVQGFLYQDPLNPIAELNAEGDIVARFVYGSKANVPDYMEKGGKTYRIVSDHLGSPRLVIDTASGEVAQRMAYDEFGNVMEDGHPAFQPFGFAGGIYDVHTGLVRFGARDYDPRTGRWMNKDPIRFSGGDVNLYTYVWSDPINGIDPFGLAELCSSPAFGWMPMDHQWIKTDSAEAGMGAPGDTDVGNNSQWPYSQVELTDHSNRTDGQCRTIDGVDDNKVNDRLKLGTPLGRWHPFNQCQSFARDVLFDSAQPGQEGLVRESYYGPLPISP